MNQLNVTSQKRKPAPAVNPILEGAKMILGGGFGLFFAVLLLSYFWGIDLLGMQGRAKRDPQQVASAAPVTPARVKEKVSPVERSEHSSVQSLPPEKKLTPPPIPREVLEAALRASPEPTKSVSFTKPEPISTFATEVQQAPQGQPAEATPSPSASPSPAAPVIESTFQRDWSGESKIISGPGAGDDNLVSLHIGSRAGDKFQGTFRWKNLRSNNEGEYPVEGTISGPEITWTWDRDGKATGKIADGVILATWQEGRMDGVHSLKVVK